MLRLVECVRVVCLGLGVLLTVFENWGEGHGCLFRIVGGFRRHVGLVVYGPFRRRSLVC